ncbi:MAG: HlyD family secretion protein, partial [Hyphomicrobiales bacterium]|nr:HlyD family secretion protein [Hyphomicrobiales bacterium]
RAPFAGLIADLERDIHAGRWINSDHPLATLHTPGGAIVRGYAEEEQVARLTVGSTGQFVPEDFNRPKVNVRLGQISRSNIQAVELAYLSSENGFGVPVVKQPDGTHAPVKPQYGLRLSVDGDLSDQVIRGHVHLKARPESLVAQVWRQVIQVLVRESGV